MSAHTKGPWEVHSFGEIDFSDPTELGLYEVVEANEEIGDLVRLGQYEKAREVMRANRALIKAAPKMKDALRRLAADRHTHVNMGDGTDACKRCGQDLRSDVHFRLGESRATDLALALDALALAEGRIRE